MSGCWAKRFCSKLDKFYRHDEYPTYLNLVDIANCMVELHRTSLLIAIDQSLLSARACSIHEMSLKRSNTITG